MPMFSHMATVLDDKLRCQKSGKVSSVGATSRHCWAVQLNAPGVKLPYKHIGHKPFLASHAKTKRKPLPPHVSGTHHGCEFATHDVIILF